MNAGWSCALCEKFCVIHASLRPPTGLCFHYLLKGVYDLVPVANGDTVCPLWERWIHLDLQTRRESLVGRATRAVREGAHELPSSLQN